MNQDTLKNYKQALKGIEPPKEYRKKDVYVKALHGGKPIKVDKDGKPYVEEKKAPKQMKKPDYPKQKTQESRFDRYALLLHVDIWVMFILTLLCIFLLKWM